VIREIREVREERYVHYVHYVHYIQEGFHRSTVVYLRTLSPYLDSSFLIVIFRIQLELICWATTPPVIITLLTLRITYTPSLLTGPTVVLAIRFRYIITT